MKITLITNYDAASSLALNYLESALSKHTSTVFYTNKSNLKPTGSSNRLYQLSEFDKRILDPNIFEKLGAKELNQINTGSDLERFQTSNPDLVISIRHMSILKDEVIQQAKHGVINLHSGLLPDFRGVMATFWAMHQQQSSIGTTLHKIEDSSIDTGSVISTDTIIANYNKSYLWNTLSLYKTGCESIERAIESISSGERLESVGQSSEGGAYYTFPEESTLAEFKYDLFSKEDDLEVFL